MPLFRSFRARRQARRYYPPPVRLRRLEGWLAARVPLVLVGLRLLLTVAAVGHLGLMAFFPAGYNRLFDVAAPPALAYTTLARLQDALGFNTRDGEERFVVYKVYWEDGSVQQGTFPDPTLTPRLRYDRWVLAGKAVSGGDQELHAALLRYVLERLPARPLKVEMYAAQRQWPREVSFLSAAGEPVDASMQLTYLGAHDGVTLQWSPAGERKRR